MFCPNCGKEIDNKATICIHCGIKINNHSQTNDIIKAIVIVVAIILLIVIMIVVMVAILSPSLSKGIEETRYVVSVQKARNILISITAMNKVFENPSIKEMDEKKLTDYFSEQLDCTRLSNNSLKVNDGMIYEFHTKGKCNNDNCRVIVDVNGEKYPNKLWTSESKEPGDRIEFRINLNKKHIVDFVNPPKRLVEEVNKKRL